MKAIGRVLGLFLAGSTVAVVGNCGGKTEGDTPGQTEASGGGVTNGGSSGNLGGSAEGGSVASGGSTMSSPSGGSTAVTTVAPRTPATHRPVASSCVGVHSPPAPSGTISGGNCSSHADCNAGKNGKCINGIGMAWSYYWCVYDECDTDADCGSSMVCHCTESTSARCLSLSKCQTDADCGGGSHSFCSPSMGFDCSGYHSVEAYYCHTPADECMDDSDCSGRDYCNFDIYAGRWTCTAPNDNCAIG